LLTSHNGQLNYLVDKKRFWFNWYMVRKLH